MNKAEEKLIEARKTGDFSLIKHWLREKAFNGSGHILHTLYWESMGPKCGGKPSGKLLKQIEEQYGSFEGFQKEFSAATAAVEGSGWGVLAISPCGSKLVILQAEKHQDMTVWGAKPIMVCDVW